MKISVITINYNNIDGLRKTIDSVLSQTYKDTEYILIDGGSTDGSVEYILSLPKGAYTYFVSEPDKGIYDAMNKGLNKSTGDYIIFMNSGDAFFSSKTLYSIFSDYSYFDDVIYGSTLYKYNEEYVLREPRALEVLSHELPFCHQSTFVKGDIIRAMMFDLRFRFIADYNMLYNLWRSGNNFKKVPHIISIYDASGVSANSKYEFKIYEERCLIHGVAPIRSLFLLRKIKEKIKGFIRVIIPTGIRNLLLKRDKDAYTRHNIDYFKKEYQ